MCLGVPAQIVALPEPQRAEVSISGVTRTISTDLLPEQNLQPGDWVLVHVGFALSKVDEQEAQTTLQQIKQLGGGTFEDEIAAFASSAI